MNTAYYADNNPSQAKRGRLWKVTNAVGHVYEYVNYDQNGLPINIKDPNGVVTLIKYTARGWLRSVQVGSRITSYLYDKTGLVSRVNFPNGSFVEYAYDSAHQLTDIVNDLGERIHYDNGITSHETRYDATEKQVSRSSKVMDNLGRLWKETRKINGHDVSDTYTYDPEGNMVKKQNGLLNSNKFNYDSLNRLFQTIDAIGGVIETNKDIMDSVYAITPPHGLTTDYDVDAFGQVIQTSSPDTGVSKYTYDLAGNLVSKTDARGVTLTYIYDASNRLIKINRPNGTNSSFEWDTGSYGIGRLSAFSDEAGKTNIEYSTYGERIKVHTRFFLSSPWTSTVAYAYYPGGGTKRIDYPSGMLVEYTRDSGRASAVSINGVSALGGIDYFPFSSMPTKWTWGNKNTHSITFNTQTGWMTTYPLESEVRNIKYNDAGRIISYIHNDSSKSQRFIYDPADRLTLETNNLGSTIYSYDIVGNRRGATYGGDFYAYEYGDKDYRLNSLAGPAAKNYKYDASGNITHDGNYTFVYNDFGRLARLDWASQSTYYRYNALGERVQKSGRGTINGPIRYVYDDRGHLLGEYDKSGKAIQETIWLDDLPVAVRISGNTYYVQADHLNTPRRLFDKYNRTVWRWDSDAFGVGLAEEDPDGDGMKLNYPLRLPGQYFDGESGLHYNINRYYDPRSGRYTSFDPIGLAGGLNGYSYVGGNPVSYVDPDGLRSVMPPGTPWRGTGDINGQIWFGNQMRNGYIQNHDYLMRRVDELYGPKLVSVCVRSTCEIPQQPNRCTSTNPTGASSLHTSGPVMSAPGAAGCVCLETRLEWQQ